MTIETTARAPRWQEGIAFDPRVDEILRHLAVAQNEVAMHPVYSCLDSLDHTRSFMEHHAFAVLDFMWLLKSLQRALTCVDVPWVPIGGGAARRFINEIVLEEESDIHLGRWTSHFELYLSAMREAGADTGPICRFVNDLRGGTPPPVALTRCGAPAAAERFVMNTWAVVARGRTHEIAGAFAFGRENLIPSMFTALIALREKVPGRVDTLLDYLSRHIELDGEHHTPLAFGMVAEICGEDAAKWSGVVETALGALRARIDLWDAVVATSDHRQRTPSARRSSMTHATAIPA